MRRFPMVVALVVCLLGRTGAARAQDSAGSMAATADSAVAGPEPAAAAKTSTQAAAPADKFRLLTEEIDASRLPNGYELVDRLRRPWLRKDALTGAAVVLYLDDQNIGGPEKLRDIPAADIAELRYLPNEQAVRRWGATAVAGSVIVVIRRR